MKKLIKAIIIATAVLLSSAPQVVSAFDEVDFDLCTGVAKPNPTGAVALILHKSDVKAKGSNAEFINEVASQLSSEKEEKRYRKIIQRNNDYIDDPEELIEFIKQCETIIGSKLNIMLTLYNETN